MSASTAEQQVEELRDLVTDPPIADSRDDYYWLLDRVREILGMNQEQDW